MKMKCPQCKAKIEKGSKYCQYCGCEIAVLESNFVEQTTSGNEPTNKTAFVTCGDIFLIGNDTVLVGIAVQNIKVGDVLNFNGNPLVIQQIDTFKVKNVPNVESGNCALRFGCIKHNELKADILKVCKQFSSTNKPIYFSTKPTTEYVFMDFE